MPNFWNVVNRVIRDSDILLEVLDLGFDEYLDSGSQCFIEWPEIAEPLLPDRYLEVSILNPEKELRVFNIYKHG